MPLINFSGLASGIDSAAFIEATLNARRQTFIVPNENRKSVLEDQNSSLTELKSLLNNFRTALGSLQTLNGGATKKSAFSSDESILTATANNSAAKGSYGINVLSLAKNATFSFDDRYASADSTINNAITNNAPEADRTVSITVGSETVGVVLDSTTTLEQFASSFNSQSSNATASVVNTGTSASPSYALMITSNETGVADGSITLSSVGSEIQSAGSGAFTSNTLSQATDLEFTLDGIAGTLTRSTNTVNDVLEGVSFTASQVGTVKLEIDVDKEATTSSVRDVVDAYNEIVSFLAENNTITREENGSEVTNIFGPLATTRTDDNILSTLRRAISSSSLGAGGEVNSLADLGITTNRDGTLAFDESKFQTALETDDGRTSSILENLSNSLASTGGTIDQFTRFGGLLDQSLQSNANLIQSISDRIARAEQSLAQEEQSLVSRFARLEATISKMQGAQSALVSALSGLGT